MIETAKTLTLLADALAQATGHLRSHCRCAGDSTCVPCEVTASSNVALEELRAWRAQAVGLIDRLGHEARCASAIASSREDCAGCMRLDRDAGRAHAQARSWEEPRRV